MEIKPGFNCRAFRSGIPIKKKDIDLLEGVQRRATKMMLGYKHYCYEDRLALCHLLTLEDRRLRGDLIQAFKLLKGLDQINYNNFFVKVIIITVQ